MSKTRQDEALDSFFDNYDLLDEAYDLGLIKKEVSYNAFSYDLEKALNDKTARAYLAESIKEEDDLHGGALDLAKDFKIKFQPISDSDIPAPASHRQAP